MKIEVLLVRLPVLLVFLLLAACAGPTSRFIVLPSPDGKVGTVQVSTEAGDVTLNTAYAATLVAQPGVVPPPPAAMPEAEVTLLFNEALKALPSGPVSFMLYFDFATVQLTGDSEKVLITILDHIKQTGSTDIAVIGHADRVGTPAVNARISSERARAIAARLKGRGVDPASIRTDYYGDTFPLVNTPRGVPEPRNRRVEVAVR